MTVYDALVKARNNITEPSRWTHQVCARNEYGVECHPTSKDARQWCAYGTLKKILPNELPLYEEAASKLREAARSIGRSNVSAVNDNEGHAAVLSLYSDAIELADDDEIARVAAEEAIPHWAEPFIAERENE